MLQRYTLQKNGARQRGQCCMVSCIWDVQNRQIYRNRKYSSDCQGLGRGERWEVAAGENRISFCNNENVLELDSCPRWSHNFTKWLVDYSVLHSLVTAYEPTSFPIRLSMSSRLCPLFLVLQPWEKTWKRGGCHVMFVTWMARQFSSQNPRFACLAVFPTCTTLVVRSPSLDPATSRVKEWDSQTQHPCLGSLWV